MKKAAIISLYGNSNFGNKLQNYAVQEVLKKYNFEVTNIINIPCLNNKKISYKRVLKFYIKAFIEKIIHNNNIHDCLDCADTKERQKAFLEFNKYINNTSFFFSFSKIRYFRNFDYFFVGSDQIWNPLYGGLSDLDLLTFTEKNKIAISASFGIDEIPEQYKEKTANSLKKFKGISVREENGKKIVENLTNRQDVEVLVDPTMLLSIDEWNSVSKKPKMLKTDKYVLCYFLGDLSDEKKEQIYNLAAKNNCEVINILDPNSEYYSCGPSEFIYLESHANLIFTDSFHSCVFAILYNIPFIVYNREGKRNDMNSRIITLLNKFELNDRLYGKRDLNDMFKIDYTRTNELLTLEREKAQNFLNKNVD